MNKGEVFDKKTQKFFDDYVPEYPEEWFNRLIDFVKKNPGEKQSIIDLGCGAGNVLALFKRNYPFSRCLGVDISTILLEKARSKWKLETFEGSILDDTLPSKIGSGFDYAIVGQLLHHLVATTRNTSKANARKALINAFKFLKPGGHLLVLEPTYSPSLSCSMIFWIKQVLSRMFSRRIEFFKKYHNLGVPVVSFLTSRELKKMLSGIEVCTIVKWSEDNRHVSWLMRLGMIHALSYVSCILRKEKS